MCPGRNRQANNYPKQQNHFQTALDDTASPNVAIVSIKTLTKKPFVFLFC
jgi:hypothetical protein